MGYFKQVLDNCSEASMLALKSKDEKISLKQRFEMHLHIYFCKCCENFVKQSHLIDTSLKAYFDKEHPPLKASDDFKARLKEKLR